MKKTVAILLVLCCILGLAGCAAKASEENSALTIETLKTLAKKGEDLTWSDFAQYPSEEIGSGLYILRYVLEEGHVLLIGGVPDEKPMYITLFPDETMTGGIDIRRESIDLFLK